MTQRDAGEPTRSARQTGKPLSAAWVALPLATFALLAAACHAPKGDGGRPVAELDLKDFSVPEMFEKTCSGVGRPFVIVMPEKEVKRGLSLALKGVDERRVFEALVRLDPTFRWELREGVALMQPVAPDPPGSIVPVVIPELDAEAGAYEVVRRAVTHADAPPGTRVECDNVGSQRPVKVSARGKSVKEILLEVARQAHLGIRADSRNVVMFTVPDA